MDWITTLVVLLCPVVTMGTGPVCQQPIGNCQCDTDQGMVDLNPVSAAGNPPFYEYDSSDFSGDKFSYDPCNTFSEGWNECNSVLVCLVYNYYTDYLSLGNSPTWDNDPSQDNALMLTYSNWGGDSIYREAKVTLICDENAINDDFQADGETWVGSGVYTFTLKSKHACPEGASNPSSTRNPNQPGSPGGAGISVGSILCIVVLVLVVVYVVGGILIQKVGRGAEGTEMIPNKSFWTSLPSLIADGFRFTFSGIKSAVSGNRSGYDQV